MARPECHGCTANVDHSGGTRPRRYVPAGATLRHRGLSQTFSTTDPWRFSLKQLPQREERAGICSGRFAPTHYNKDARSPIQNLLTAKSQGLITLGLGVLIAIAAALPWANVMVFSVNGTSGDGIFTLAIGGLLIVIGIVIAAKPAALPRKVTFIGTGLLGLVTLIIFTADLVQLSTLAGDAENEFEEALSASVSPGIGLILTGLLGAAAVAYAILGVLKADRVPPANDPLAA